MHCVFWRVYLACNVRYRLSSLFAGVTFLKIFGSSNTTTAIRGLNLWKFPCYLWFSDPQIVKTANTKSSNSEGRLYIPHKIFENACGNGVWPTRLYNENTSKFWLILTLIKESGLISSSQWFSTDVSRHPSGPWASSKCAANLFPYYFQLWQNW